MNENFKLSKTSRNDLESVCIVIRSVPAKFGLPTMFRRGTRGGYICPKLVTRVPEILYPLLGQWGQ